MLIPKTGNVWIFLYMYIVLVHSPCNFLWSYPVLWDRKLKFHKCKCLSCKSFWGADIYECWLILVLSGSRRITVSDKKGNADFLKRAYTGDPLHQGCSNHYPVSSKGILIAAGSVIQGSIGPISKCWRRRYLAK